MNSQERCHQKQFNNLHDTVSQLAAIMETINQLMRLETRPFQLTGIKTETTSGRNGSTLWVNVYFVLDTRLD